MHYLWNIFLYQPLVNALAFLVSVVPGGDVGMAVVLLTILVKILLFPLSQSQIRNQAAMNLLAPEINKIKESGVNKEEQARLTFELYKKHKTNPFTGCLIMIPTLLVIIALYNVFFTGIKFDNGLLYSFIHVPENMNMYFLGLFDISGNKIIILSILAGVSQYAQAYFMPKIAKTSKNTGSFQDSFAQSMQMQMKYVFPFIISLISYNFSGAVALYLITNNVFSTLQQIYVQKTENKVLDSEVEVMIHPK
jgi:YidC/Oxa1 family membrane protein insertase